jgi:hypothetical protein
MDAVGLPVRVAMLLAGSTGLRRDQFERAIASFARVTNLGLVVNFAVSQNTADTVECG